MTRLTFHPLTPDRWDDFVALFETDSICRMCWCVHHRLPAEVRRETDSKSRALLLAHLAAGLSLAEQERLSPVFQERARLFLVDNERGQKLVARVGARQVPLTASQPNGHFRSLVTLPGSELSKRCGPPAQLPAR